MNWIKIVCFGLPCIAIALLIVSSLIVPLWSQTLSYDKLKKLVVDIKEIAVSFVDGCRDMFNTLKDWVGSLGSNILDPDIELPRPIVPPILY